MQGLRDDAGWRPRVRGAHRRLGLRARIIAAFALGALLLSGLLSAVTYGLVRENLLRQRENTATSRVFFNAAIVRDQLRTEDVDRAALLEGLQTPAGSAPVLFDDDQWYAPSLERSRDQVPTALRAEVVGGTPARMRYRLAGDSTLAIGVPMPAVGAAYFEIVSLATVEDALESLTIALVAAALVTTLAGATLGAWGSRRLLRPLAEVSDAAAAITGGELETRLEDVEDPDLRLLVDSFNNMVQALQERIERDTRFASDVSHELRSPLTTLSASIEVLQSRRDEMPDRAQFALDLLAADVQRFQGMVEDLLEISRVDAGATALDREPVRISELVLHAIAMSTDSDTEDFPVDIDAACDDILVLADKRRLVRIIANLLDNARKYGGGVAKVDVMRHDGTVVVAVEDDGPGVPAEDRELIFERFSRGSASGRRSGTDGVGLGLALVREHVRLHGGSVHVEDRDDGRAGARFVVELPVLEPDEAAEEEIE